MQLSVIICTHNPRADYLRRTLDGLKRQTLPKEEWELLFIDNASKERLAEVWDLSWHPLARHIREDELGAAAARLRGIREFRAPILVFVDDDNVLAPDYLAQSVKIASRFPHLGVFGAGVIEPEFEISPPRELSRYLHMLALRKVALESWSNNPRDGISLPYGAGMAVRRSVANHCLQLAGKINASKLLGPQGPRQFRHEDDLFSWASVECGLGFGVFPELHIHHLIAGRRLNQDFFLQLIHDSGFSGSILHYLLAGESPRGIGFFHLIHLILHGMRNGVFSMRCRWACLRGEAAAKKFIEQNKLETLATPAQMFSTTRIRPGLSDSGFQGTD